jgi:tetratricopeptide (TPR) repeat protein
MKKLLMIAVLFAIVATGFLAAQNEGDEAYIKAMTQKDPCQKVQGLKAYLQNYAGKGSQYENFAYVYLCLTPCQSKAASESIQYGEKALTMSGIDEASRIQILMTLSTLYTQSGQNLDKAKAHANQVIEIAKANKAKEPSETQWDKMIGAGLFLQGQAAEKAKDTNAAADAYINSYAILKDAKIMAQIKKLAKTLYDAKEFAEAEKVFRTLYNQSKDPESALILGQTLYKNDKPDEALALFKEAYAKKKTGELAYNIGIILAKKSPQEAIDYLIVASFLYPDQSQNALGMAQNLFFTSSPDAKINDVIKKIEEKQKKIDELTKSFNTKFAERDEEDLSDNEKTEMKKILADIDVQKAEIAKLQASSSDMTSKWTKRMDEVKKKTGIS